jgi:predicted transcriptional regulator
MTGESFNEKLVGEMFIAYVSNNSVEPSQIEDVVRAISRAFSKDNHEELAARQDPAVPIDESITPNYLTCLEDGKQFKSLKRHLGMHGMTPDEYRPDGVSLTTIRWWLRDIPRRDQGWQENRTWA